VIYAFKNEETGEIIERDFRMGAAPGSVTENGKTYQRYYGSMTVIYGPSFHTEGQVKFKRGPIEGDYDYI